MKRAILLIMAAGFVLGGAAGASALDFKIKGEWNTFFNIGETSMFKKPYDTRNLGVMTDVLEPDTRIRLQFEAAASEDLSGTLQFEMGPYGWGTEKSGPEDRDGASMGERSVSVRVKRAYMDWRAPGINVHFRMGIQGIALPNAAGGSAVLDEDVAAVSASYTINDHVGITAVWARPYNDNYKRNALAGTPFSSKNPNSAFDNVDLGMLAVPLTFDGVSVTPWGMFGMMGKNAARWQLAHGHWYPGSDSDYVQRGMFPVDLTQRSPELGGLGAEPNAKFRRAYASMVWAGIPLKISAFDPINLELDANYGYISGFGRYNDLRARNADGTPRRNDSKREGFVLKALAEYKTDWGIPGVFGWYGSGDSGNPRNGSGRMPYLAPCGDFSSFGLGGYYGDFRNLAIGERIDTGYSGTWAVGAQIKDLSFLNDLSHTLRAIYWRGTSDPAMARSLRSPQGMDLDQLYTNLAWNNQPASTVYLTTNDYLVEFNLDSTYKIYENLETCVELGYIVNGVDKRTWKWSGNQKEDAWKISVNLRYSF
ncbi:MAG: outer membrane homotrimeric porin [Desulfovibrionaceae bacterium]|nr:outer membrane homotrimeric porin [Desulfovibrionaceae bacterium]